MVAMTETITWSTLKENNELSMRQLMTSFADRKAIVWHHELMPRMRLVCGFTVIKGMGVEHQYTLDTPGPVQSCDVDDIIYIVPPTMPAIKLVCAKLLATEDTRRHHLVYVPRESVLCETHLRSTVSNLDIHLYPLDVDCLSMESHSLLGDMLVYDDWSHTHHVAHALQHVTKLYEQPAKVESFGGWATKAHEQWLAMSKEGGKESTRETKGINHMVIISRQIDLLTPLAHQLTYAALIDDVFGIRAGVAIMPSDRFNASSEADSQSSTKHIRLSSENDDLYSDIRDKHINAVAPTLSKHIKRITQWEESRHDTKTIREYHDFVKRLPQLTAAKKSAGEHTTITELLQEYVNEVDFAERFTVQLELLNGAEPGDKPITLIEDVIARCDRLDLIVRLIGIQSLTSDGLKPKVYDTYVKQMCASYGHDRVLPLMILLNRIGMITLKASVVDMPYAQLRRAFELFDEHSTATCASPSFAYGGYIPFTIRLCHRAIQSTTDWGGARLPCKYKRTELHTSTNAQNPNEEKTVFVFFIGGCTHGELAALRKVASLCDVNLLIGTTSMINGRSMIDSINVDM